MKTMKLMKKLMVVFVALFMVASLATRVNADGNDGKITLTVTEVSNEQFEEFKQSLGN